MNRSAPRRPALPHGLALLAGFALAQSGTGLPPWTGWAGAALLFLAFLARRRGGGGAGLALGALLLAGLALGRLDAERDATRLSTLLPEAGLAVESEFLGRVRGLPEATPDDEHLLTLRGTMPGRGGESALTVRLVVRSASQEGRARVEALGSGDLVRVWTRLVVPRGYGNPGSSDPAAALRAAGLDAVGRVKSSLLVEPLRRGRWGPLRGIEALKREARRRLDEAVGPQGRPRAILGAVLLGDRAGISVDSHRALRAGGLVHLVAISGLHVGLLAAIWFGALRRAGLSNGLLLLLACFWLPAFGWAVGARPPVVRAALAAGVALAGRCAGREGDAVNGLALFAAVILLADPGALLNAGFQLSFLATAGILLRARTLAGLLPGPRWLALGLAVSASAYLGAAPVAVWHFRWLAPVALASNLVAAPLCALLLLWGYGAIALFDLPWLGAWLASLAGATVDGLLWLASFSASFEFAGWRVARPSVWCVAVYYGSLFGPPLLGPAKRGGWRIWIGGALGLSAIWLHVGPPPAAPPLRLEAAIVDVGQGQAVALRRPEGGTVLVDAGGGAHPRFDPGERLLLPILDRWGVRRIDLLACSHGDIDHVGGAFAVLRELEVGELWLPPGWHGHPRLAALAALARERGAAVALVARGRESRSGGVPLRVLAPGRESLDLSENDRSLVLLAGRAPTRVLIAGDLEQGGESALLAGGEDPAAEALVVGHHGAAGGTGSEFLARVGPRHALISCGFRNRFGHPHPDTLERLRGAGVEIWRTDRHGLVRLVAGEEGWAVTATRR